MSPLQPSAQLLEKLAGIVHTALHQAPGTPLDVLCRDPDVVDWARGMQALGRLPDPTKGV